MGGRPRPDLPAEVLRRRRRRPRLEQRAQLPGVARLRAGDHPGDGLHLGDRPDADGHPRLGPRHQPPSERVGHGGGAIRDTASDWSGDGGPYAESGSPPQSARTSRSSHALRRRTRMGWPAAVRQRPVSRSKRQPCRVHVSSQSVDLAEHGQVGVAVRAAALHDPAAELDVGLGLGRRVEPAHGLGLGAPHPLDRQRLEEVVDLLVELAVAPGAEAARQEQRVAPVDGPLGDDRLDQRHGRCRTGSRTARRRRAGPRRPGSRRAPRRRRPAAGRPRRRRPAPSGPSPAAAPTTPAASAPGRRRRAWSSRPSARRSTAASRPGTRAGTSPCRSKMASTSPSATGWVTSMSSGVTSIVVPGTARMPWWPESPRRSRNARWSTKMLGSSPVMTLRWNSSGSRKHGGPALGTTARAPTDST